MAQPYDYSLNLPSPFTAFTQGMQVGQVSRATELERQKAQAEADRAQRLNAAIAQLGPNATYADYMAAINANPDFTDTLLSRWNTMSEANKGALFDAGARAWQFLTPDLEGNLDPTRAIAALEESATAFENSGQTDMAQQLRDSARAIQVNPEVANSTLGLMLAATNPDGFKKLSESTTTTAGDSTFIRELIAEGKQPGTPEFVEALRRKREGDPWISVPGVGLFDKREVEAAFAANEPRVAAIPQEDIDYLMANPETASQFDQHFGQPGLADRILRGEQ